MYICICICKYEYIYIYMKIYTCIGHPRLPGNPHTAPLLAKMQPSSNPKSESSLLTTYWSESIQSSR